VKWIIHSEVKSETVALEFCRELANDFATTALAWVRIDLGRGRHTGAYGRCWYPAGKGSSRKGYRISVQVPGPFPYVHRRYVRPLYQNLDGTWPPIPLGSRPAGYCESMRNGVVKRWQRLTTEYVFETRAIGIVHVFGHEMFHFLRHSRQIPGRNGENEADQFALSIETTFRERLDEHDRVRPTSLKPASSTIR
jgi:hypothetical protein